MRVPDGAVHAARLRRPRHHVLHREHHVRGVPRAGLRAAAAAEADGPGRPPGPKEWARLLQVRSMKYEGTAAFGFWLSAFVLRTSYFILPRSALALSLNSRSSGAHSGSGGASRTFCSSARASGMRPWSRSSSARKKCDAVLVGL